MFAAWSIGNDQAYRARRFGCREIKVPSAPIFVNTVYRFFTVTTAFLYLYLNIMYRCCGSDRRNNLQVSVSD